MLTTLDKLIAQKYIIQIDEIHKRHGTGVNGKIGEAYYFKIFTLGAEARDNADVMLHAFKKCENHLIGRHIGKFLSDDVEFLKKAVEINPAIYQHGSSKARNDFDLAKQTIENYLCIYKNSYIYKSIGDDLKENKDLALFAMKTHTQTYQYMSSTLQADKDVINCALDKGPLSQSETRYLLDSFNAIPSELRSDFKLMKKVASVIHETGNDHFRHVLDCKECEKFKDSIGESGSVLKSMQSWELSQNLQAKLKPKIQSQTPRMKI